MVPLAETREMQPASADLALQPGVDELLWRPGRAVRAGRLEVWKRSFALSTLGQATRPRWNPSEKQLATLRRLIAGLAQPAEALIDDEADNAAA